LRGKSTRWRSAALTLAVLALCALVPTVASARQVRVFAVNPKLDLAWMESRDTYRGKMFALADRSVRGPGVPLVQQGADDVVSHLLGPSDPARPRETARDLVAWPEDIGLFAALTGERARPARGSGSLEGAVVTLIGLYAQQNAYYQAKYPQLGQRGVPTRLLGISLTDTFGRVAVETFAEMADRYDVYLHAGVNMAQEWQVVCRDMQAFNSASPPRLPGGVRCEEQSPQKVQQLGDPFEPQRDYVYEATSPKASNMALLFDPDGRLVAKQVKTYITPAELPGQGLDLVPGAVSDGLSAVHTPVGVLGFVTSKDAWMPDVVQKLDQRGVEVLVQPEFFVGDLTRRAGMWSADTLKASGYNDLLRHPSIEALVLPELVGNVFNFSADQQGHIAVEPRRGVGSGFLLGQPPTPGLVDVMPWVVPDPARPDEPFPERRQRLGEAGEKLAPRSGERCPDPSQPGPCENGHVETVLFRDVEVGRAPGYRRFRGRRARTRLSRSRPVARSRRTQRNAAVSLHGRRGAAVWEELTGAHWELRLARTRDYGRTWSRARDPIASGSGGADEWWPAVATGARGRVTIAWVERTEGSSESAFPPPESARVLYAHSTNGGRRFGAAVALDPSAPEGVDQWKPSLAPGSGNVVHAVFVDERVRSMDDDLPQAGVYYSRIVRGRAGEAQRLDSGQPAANARKMDNSWAPTVSAKGSRVLVSWIDFLNYDWDVFARYSTDGGESFGEQQPVNDATEDDPRTSANEQQEALAASPEAVVGRGPFVAWVDWRKRDSSATQPHQQYDIFLARPGGANRQVDPYGARQLSAFHPTVCADTRNRVLVAFQDASRGHNDVRIVRMTRGRRRGRARRVDDAGSRRINAWRPELGCWEDRAVVLWEDERDGPAQIYFAAANARRLR
jgi:hypothetical protein